jgi:hypothetical protein
MLNDLKFIQPMINFRTTFDTSYLYNCNIQIAYAEPLH